MADERREITPEQTAARLARLSKKSKARRAQLRQLNKHVRFLQQCLNDAYRHGREKDQENRNLHKLMQHGPLCRRCRFIEWYRFRQGEIHLSRPGWRFLRWLPRLRWS